MTELLFPPLSSAPQPWIFCLWALGGATVLCWVLQSLTRNYSWVDRLWSIMPPVYGWIFLAFSREPRIVIMAILATLWGVRLTFNFARKGGYSPKEEDYRWPIVRDWLAKHDPLHPLGRELFSLLFIAVYQHALIALFSLPAFLAVYRQAGTPLGMLDAAATVTFLAFLAIEAVTDQQQWNFQKAKHQLSPQERQTAGGDFARGFNTRGLFRFSRHMNFFAEIMQWWAFALFPIAAGTPWINGTLVGPFLLTLLFQGSTWLTELISISRYPAYAQYQETTSRLLPWFPGPSLDAEERSSHAARTGSGA